MPSAKPDLPPELRQRLQRFAEGVAKDFGPWLAAAPGRRDQLAAFLRALLPAYPARRGRKRTMAVAQAIELRQQGVAWQQVFLRCIHNYSAMDSFERKVRRQSPPGSARCLETLPRGGRRG